MLVGGNNGVNNQYLNVLFYPLGSVATPNPMPACLNGAKDEIDGTEREFTTLFPNAGTEKKSVQICQKSRRIGCVILCCNLQCGITQHIL